MGGLEPVSGERAQTASEGGRGGCQRARDELPSLCFLFVRRQGHSVGGWQAVPLHSDAVLSSMKAVWREEVESVGHDSIMAGGQSFV